MTFNLYYKIKDVVLKSSAEKKAKVTATLKACGGPAVCQRSSVPAQHSLISISPSTQTTLFLSNSRQFECLSCLMIS